MGFLSRRREATTTPVRNGGTREVPDIWQPENSVDSLPTGKAGMSSEVKGGPVAVQSERAGQGATSLSNLQTATPIRGQHDGEDLFDSYDTSHVRRTRQRGIRDSETGLFYPGFSFEIVPNENLEVRTGPIAKNTSGIKSLLAKRIKKHEPKRNRSGTLSSSDDEEAREKTADRTLEEVQQALNTLRSGRVKTSKPKRTGRLAGWLKKLPKEKSERAKNRSSVQRFSVLRGMFKDTSKAGPASQMDEGMAGIEGEEADERDIAADAAFYEQFRDLLETPDEVDEVSSTGQKEKSRAAKTRLSTWLDESSASENEGSSGDSSEEDSSEDDSSEETNEPVAKTVVKDENTSEMSSHHLSGDTERLDKSSESRRNRTSSVGMSRLKPPRKQSLAFFTEEEARPVENTREEEIKSKGEATQDSVSYTDSPEVREGTLKSSADSSEEVELSDNEDLVDQADSTAPNNSDQPELTLGTSVVASNVSENDKDSIAPSEDGEEDVQGHATSGPATSDIAIDDVEGVVSSDENDLTLPIGNHTSQVMSSETEGPQTLSMGHSSLVLDEDDVVPKSSLGKLSERVDGLPASQDESLSGGSQPSISETETTFETSVSEQHSEGPQNTMSEDDIAEYNRSESNKVQRSKDVSEMLKDQMTVYRIKSLSSSGIPRRKSTRTAIPWEIAPKEQGGLAEDGGRQVTFADKAVALSRESEVPSDAEIEELLRVLAGSGGESDPDSDSQDADEAALSIEGDAPKLEEAAQDFLSAMLSVSKDLLKEHKASTGGRSVRMISKVSFADELDLVTPLPVSELPRIVSQESVNSVTKPKARKKRRKKKATGTKTRRKVKKGARKGNKTEKEVAADGKPKRRKKKTRKIIKRDGSPAQGVTGVQGHVSSQHSIKCDEIVSPAAFSKQPSKGNGLLRKLTSSAMLGAKSSATLGSAVTLKGTESQRTLRTTSRFNIGSQSTPRIATGTKKQNKEGGKSANGITKLKKKRVKKKVKKKKKKTAVSATTSEPVSKQPLAQPPSTISSRIGALAAKSSRRGLMGSAPESAASTKSLQRVPSRLPSTRVLYESLRAKPTLRKRVVAPRPSNRRISKKRGGLVSGPDGRTNVKSENPGYVRKEKLVTDIELDLGVPGKSAQDLLTRTRAVNRTSKKKKKKRERKQRTSKIAIPKSAVAGDSSIRGRLSRVRSSSLLGRYLSRQSQDFSAKHTDAEVKAVPELSVKSKPFTGE